MSTQINNYRPDIDGLRAVAVVSVLLFHAFPQALPGGFVGVDIFFVISGYLISGILVRETEEGRFSILKFYIRRARRLFPALLTVLGATLVLAWLIMFPSEWRALGKHMAAGATFLSNGALLLEAGYFDNSSDLKPLLHLWSLAVEEQFYLVWPMVIFLTTRRNTAALAWVTVTFMVLSFLSSVALTPRNATLAFYLPITRFWELLIGSGLAIWQARRPAVFASLATPQRAGLAHSLSLLALSCLLASIVLFTQATAFPGYAAALPVVGAALSIAAGPGAMVNRWLLGSRAAVWIGLISYPLYLWHWPALALARIWSGESAVSAPALAGLLGLSVVLAWLTYRFVEIPLRHPSRTRHAGAHARNGWLALLLIGGLGVAAWKGVIPSHSAQSALVRKIDHAQSDWTYDHDQSWAGGRAGRVLFVGDSHMQHYAPRIAEIMATRHQEAHSVRLITLAGCAPLPGLNRLTVDCAHFTDDAYRAMQAPDVTTVVLAASWKGFSVRPDYYRTDDPQRQVIAPLTDATQWALDIWRDQLRALIQRGKHVVVVLSTPRGPLVEPQHFVHRGPWSWQELSLAPRKYQDLKGVVRDVDARVAAAAREAGAEVIDPFNAFCHDGDCDVSTPDGGPIFMDDSHIRASYVHDHVHYLDPYFFAY